MHIKKFWIVVEGLIDDGYATASSDQDDYDEDPLADWKMENSAWQVPRREMNNRTDNQINPRQGNPTPATNLLKNISDHYFDTRYDTKNISSHLLEFVPRIL